MTLIEKIACLESICLIQELMFKTNKNMTDVHIPSLILALYRHRQTDF